MSVFTGMPPQGFFYVPQDNFFLGNPLDSGISYVYCDSATSCVIIIAYGKDGTGNPIAAVSHLSSQLRFEAFFELIMKNFTGEFAFYAYGANPPTSAAASENAHTVMQFLEEHYIPKGADTSLHKCFISECTLSLGTSLAPNDGHGQLGINFTPQYPEFLQVSDKIFMMPPHYRKSDDGFQKLFCMYGMKSGIYSLVLREAGQAFTDMEKMVLVKLAEEDNLAAALQMPDSEILRRYSTTPEHEPYWFAAGVREAAALVMNSSQQFNIGSFGAADIPAMV